MHYYLDFDGYRLSLVGSVITIFNCEGKKVRQYFYSSHNIAKRVFMSLCQTWCFSQGLFFIVQQLKYQQGVKECTK